MSKKIETVDDLRKEALETLQVCINAKGMSFQEFTESRLTSRPPTHQLENHLHLTSFRSVRELYQQWFGDMITFDGNIMRITNVDRLAAGNQGLINLYSLQARTEEKGKKKPKSGRGNRPRAPKAPPVISYPSRRQTTHSAAQLQESYEYEPQYYPQHPSTSVLPHSISMPQNNYPEFDQPHLYEDSFNNPQIAPVDDYYPENEQFYENEYPEYDSTPNPYINGSYVAPPLRFSNHERFQTPQYDYGLSEDEQSTDYQSYAKRDLSKAELEFQKFAKDHHLQQDQKMNLEFSRKLYVVLRENLTRNLEADVYEFAVRISQEEAETYIERRLSYEEATVIEYFATAIVELLGIIEVEGSALSFHGALRWLYKCLLPKPGYSYFDFFKLLQKLTDIVVISESKEGRLPIIMVDAKESTINPAFICSKLKLLIKEIPVGIEDGIRKIKIFKSSNPEYPYYVVENTEKITKKMNNHLKILVGVKDVYPGLLCLVVVDKVKYRAQIISCESFTCQDDVMIELIDIGIRLRKSVKELYELTETEYIFEPRCSLPAILDYASKSLDLKLDENDFFKRMSTIRLVTVNITLKKNLIDYAIFKLV